MTPLIDRIRAYVAAIPTHECMLCGRTQSPSPDDRACESCGIGRLTQLGSSKADVLLREVAALEPVAVITTKSMRDITAQGGKRNVPCWRPAFAATRDINLYTLTGATHAPE